MCDFTLIVPSHNRHAYLKRSMDYYKNLNTTVIYCDSSEHSYEGEIYLNMVYLHLPSKLFADKVLIALKLISSKYVALCADDDFILINSLYHAVNFLKKNSDFKSAVGRFMTFNKPFDHVFFDGYGYYPTKDLNYSPEINAKLFFGNYCQILWAIYEKEILETSFEIIHKCKFKNDNFIEMVIGSCVCFMGGLKFLDIIWGARELEKGDHWGKRHKSLNNIDDADIVRDYSLFKVNVDHITMKGYSEIVIESYLSMDVFKKKPIFRRILSKGRRIFTRLLNYYKKSDNFIDENSLFFEISEIIYSNQIK